MFSSCKSPFCTLLIMLAATHVFFVKKQKFKKHETQNADILKNI